MSVFRVPTPPGKSWIFFVKFPGPGKSWKMGLVLESPEIFSERSWKVPEFSKTMMWESDTMQIQMPEFVKISSDFIGIYEKITGGRGSAPDSMVTVVRLYN